MNKLDHLLWVVAEESAEVAHRASKAARFGLTEMQPGTDADNFTRLQQEFNDLYAAMLMVAKEAGIDLSIDPLVNMIQVQAKVTKVEHYLAYSKAMGRLD